jgi:hypothetical protein
MKRNLKALGLVLAATFAFSAMAASAAQANWVFTPEVKPAVIEGEQIMHKQTNGEEGNYFEITGKKSKVRCTGAKYLGTTEALETEDVTVHPTYTGCSTATGGFPVTVDTKGCDFTLTGETDASKRGKVHLICETGSDISITIPSINCTITIHEQTPTAGGVTYTQNGTHVDATAEVTGITYEVLNPEERVLCTAAAGKNKAEANDSDLLTKITVVAFEDKGTEGTGTLTNEGLKLKEGAAVGLKIDSK